MKRLEKRLKMLQPTVPEDSIQLRNAEAAGPKQKNPTGGTTKFNNPTPTGKRDLYIRRVSRDNGPDDIKAFLLKISVTGLPDAMTNDILGGTTSQDLENAARNASTDGMTSAAKTGPSVNDMTTLDIDLELIQTTILQREIPITKPRNIRWRCVQRTTDCKATLTITLVNDDPKLDAAHNHDPCDTKVAAFKCRSQMKQQAKQSFDKPSQIMTQAMSEIDVTARVELEELALTTGPDPQQFLVYDNGRYTDSRIIIFGASDTLSTAETWFMDGNHAVAPTGICQLYVIHCPLGNTAVSTLYPLLQRKSQESSDNLLQAIVDMRSEFHHDPDPTTVAIDLEIAMLCAVSCIL
ncbi:hypothetical protein LSH36_567g01057 [Paralvinella palmiformis]|uniref:FLYWCH-type domain-containing protein n=1 Tax=Paralvinella palmiformis TaxID=53620 RepID=A0AAD9J7L2_9ANNE|nr:hypothetical protein LSH36_567g01057 [Paralvinella palmiformis]